MSYNSLTDFLAVLRRTSGGMRTASMPGLDYVIAALARAGMFILSVGQTAPTINQPITVWLRPALQSWTAEGAIFLWNAGSGAYEPATPALWNALLAPQVAVIQDVSAPGPVNILVTATVVRVLTGPVTLVMPLALNKAAPVLVSDWTANADTTLQRSGGDVFPLAATSWIVGAGGSAFLRPVPGGYAL